MAVMIFCATSSLTLASNLTIQKLQLLERENQVIERSEKENKRNMLCHQNVDIPSKALSQGTSAFEVSFFILCWYSKIDLNV